MKKIILLSLFTMFSATVFSQEISPSKREKIDKMMKLIGTSEIKEDMVNALIKAYKDNFTDVKQQFWDDLSKEFKSRNLFADIIPVYDKYYTEDDIDALIAFYQTPTGKKMLANLTNIAQESFAIGQSFAGELSNEIISKLKAKGYVE